MVARRTQTGRGRRPASREPTASHVGPEQDTHGPAGTCGSKATAVAAQLHWWPRLHQGTGAQPKRSSRAIDQAGSSPAKEQPTQVIAASVFF